MLDSVRSQSPALHRLKDEPNVNENESVHSEL
jgi:hypothetical protein